MVSFPTVQFNAGLGRGAIAAVAAGVGIAVGAQYIAPAMPKAVADFDLGFMGINGTTITIALTALVFAGLASKVGA